MQKEYKLDVTLGGKEMFAEMKQENGFKIKD
jgi:hypothetical protein